ncbi:MAG: hypothetical protein F4W92_08490 [Gammaproteobacteria bacterium]|nr:hypothetical protein [Gammaproteobacteria bacterium]
MNFHTSIQITHEFDEFVVMKTPHSLVDNVDIGYRHIARTLYRHYEDEFDWIVVIFNISAEQQQWRKSDVKARCVLVRNSIAGDGAEDVDVGKLYGSPSRLKSVIVLPTKEPLIEGFILHELMHTWVDESSGTVLPTDYPGHWGFSSVNGKLGGFKKETLELVRDRVYAVGSFSPTGARLHDGGYGALELYLAGWIPKQEVPNILVAENVKWPVKIRDEWIWTIQAVEGFEAERITTWTIDQIVDRIGERVPNASESQKHFRMATVVVENEDFPFKLDDIAYFQQQIDLFSRPESILHLNEIVRKFHNFWDATGGRATISADMASAKIPDNSVVSVKDD